VRAESRTWAINLGETRTTDSPAAIKSRSSRRVICRQSSIAHNRSSPRPEPHVTSCKSSRVVVPTVFVCLSRPAQLVNSDRGMGALVRIDADDHHGTCLPISWVARTGRSAYPNRGDATLLLSQAGRSSGVDRPQNKLKPRRRRYTQSEPADSSSLTLGYTRVGYRRTGLSSRSGPPV
jgi:hypothetical protein